MAEQSSDPAGRVPIYLRMILAPQSRRFGRPAIRSTVQVLCLVIQHAPAPRRSMVLAFVAHPKKHDSAKWWLTGSRACFAGPTSPLLLLPRFWPTVSALAHSRLHRPELKHYLPLSQAIPRAATYGSRHRRSRRHECLQLSVDAQLRWQPCDHLAGRQDLWTARVRGLWPRAAEALRGNSIHGCPVPPAEGSAHSYRSRQERLPIRVGTQLDVRISGLNLEEKA